MLTVFASHLRVCEAYALQGMLAAHGLRTYVWHEYSPALFPELTFGGAVVALDDEDLSDAEEVCRAALAEVGDAWEAAPDERVSMSFHAGKYPDLVETVKLFVKWFLVLGFVLHFAVPLLPYFDEMGEGTVDFGAMGEQFFSSCKLLAMDAGAGIVCGVLMSLAFQWFATMRDSPTMRHWGAAVLFVVYKWPDFWFCWLIDWTELFYTWSYTVPGI